jgi:hypothetical protein
LLAGRGHAASATIALVNSASAWLVDELVTSQTSTRELPGASFHHAGPP